MDNNTAQNVKFPYPDMSGNIANNNTTPVPSTTAPQSSNNANDIAKQIKEINSEVPKSYVAQPTPLPGFDASIPEPEIPLPESAAPLPSSVMSMNTLGRANNNLEEIMPDFRKPKAMSRDPKSNNLAEPVPVEDVKKEYLVDQKQDTPDTNFPTKPAPATTNGINGGTNEGKYNMKDLLSLTISRNASDLHLSAGYPPVIRVDGELETVGERILNPEDTEELIFSILTEEKRELLEVNREIDLAYTFTSANGARFRVNAFYSMKNLSAAFRLIPSRIRTIDELMLPQMYHQFAKLKQGLILVTGPTGHGKSTTLAAILEDINRTRFCHLVTIEDPVEYLFEGKKALIDQREMNDDTHSWDIALRSALRQDPDVLLIGEMRDYETIASAITLAETGHLVFATLHTNSSSQTIDRIIDVFPENQQSQVRAQLANILQAVVAQRLIPLDKGGRRAVSEIMLMNSAVGNLIREGKTNQIDNVIRTSSDIGMISLEKALVNLVREGAITIQKAQEYAVFPEEVIRLLKS